MRIVHDSEMNVPLKVWDDGVPMEPSAILQMRQVCMLPCVAGAALMPDGHSGRGGAVGAVVATRRAVVPGLVGVDIGCGMSCVRTTLTASQLPDNANQLMYDHVAKILPVGAADKKKTGNWSKIPTYVNNAWKELELGFKNVVRRHGRAAIASPEEQLGTLGGGNHLVSINLDESDNVWILLHSGSRGVGNRIGTHFIELARRDMERQNRQLPANHDLAYFEEGNEHFNDYFDAMLWAQEYARVNRQMIMRTVLDAISKSGLPRFKVTDEAINIHHNYCSVEIHSGESLYITRKGAVNAGSGVLGIIPGCMGGVSYIVRGKGNAESYESSSHGAGRVLSRGDAKKQITLEMHRKATEGVACRKDSGVLDESPAAYKNIDAVMAAQSDLVDIVHKLQEITNIKG